MGDPCIRASSGASTDAAATRHARTCPSKSPATARSSATVNGRYGPWGTKPAIATAVGSVLCLVLQGDADPSSESWQGKRGAGSSAGPPVNGARKDLASSARLGFGFVEVFEVSPRARQSNVGLVGCSLLFSNALPKPATITTPNIERSARAI